LQEYRIDARDVIIGIAASGTTPYVVHGLRTCREHGIITGCITCNQGRPYWPRLIFQYWSSPDRNL
jgi:N-acetylmuramic acid 6-phosphate etherase